MAGKAHTRLGKIAVAASSKWTGTKPASVARAAGATAKSVRFGSKLRVKNQKLNEGTGKVHRAWYAVQGERFRGQVLLG